MQNRRPGGWDNYFTVSGGPFASPQTMGWHITGEGGHTLAVSPDSEFATFCCEARELFTLMEEGDVLYSVRERRDQGYLDHIPQEKWERLKELLQKYTETPAQA